MSDDTISRASAIAEITEYGSGHNVYMSVRELKRRIEQLPSAQPQDIAQDIARIIENEKDMRVIVKNAQPEIIRCKDCKHFWLGQCGLNGLTWSYDSFCSRAERRQE